MCEANYDHFLLAGQIPLSLHTSACYYLGAVAAAIGGWSTSYLFRQTNRAGLPVKALWVYLSILLVATAGVNSCLAGQL
jgi:hypothetical protein